MIPGRFQKGASIAADAVRKLKNVLIAAHVNPDGDAIGAMAACGYILERLNSDFVLYAPDGIPPYLRFVQLPGPVYTSLGALPFVPEGAIYVDCSEPGRLGAALEGSWDLWPSVNIDHHICRQGLGSLANFIEPEAAATCQLVAYMAYALKMGEPPAFARAIGLGILTDTGNFSHSNTSADIFALCAQIEQQGCSLPKLRELLNSNWSLGRLRLWGELFTHTRQAINGKVIYSVILEQDLRRYNCAAEDLEGYIDALRRIDGVQIAVTVRQKGADSKFSLRSRDPVDVQKIAAALGGGGHRNAAGGMLQCQPEKALELILAGIENYFRGIHY